MRKILFFILIVFTLTGCDLFSPKVEEGNTITFDQYFASGARGAVFEDGTITSVRVHAYYDSDGSQLPSSPTVLTKAGDRWTGSFNYDAASISGMVYFHAVAFNASGEAIYQGTTNSNTIGNFGNSVTISTETGYSIGDKGPGGGWIVYAKPSYSTDSQHDGSWRYLEIAGDDLFRSWDEDILKIDGTMVEVDDDGNVVEKNTTNVVLYATDWYWGPAGSFSTSASIPYGVSNTEILDGVSSATPNINIKTTGRKDPAGNERRDTIDSLAAQQINGFSDWFVPSRDELLEIYDNRSSIPVSTYGMDGKSYWTSSEDTDESPESSVDQGETSTDISIDAYWGWYVDFSIGSTLDERYRVHRVRPARVF